MAAIQNINVSTPNDGLGDTLRVSQIKANDNFAELNDKKVEKVLGKDLSSNDFTDTEQTKLAGIEENAQVNVQADWLQEDDTQADFVKNKPVGDFVNAMGTLHYSDSATQTVPLTVVAGVEKKLTNDTLGAFTNIDNAAFGVASLWNATTNQFDFSDLFIGDVVAFRPELLVDLVGTNTSYRIYVKMAVGSPSEWILNIFNGERKSTDEFQENLLTEFDLDNADTINYPAEIYIKTDANATVKVNGWYFRVLRKDINIVDVTTDLSLERTSTTVKVVSLNGSDALIPAVDEVLAGIVTVAQKAGWDSKRLGFTDYPRLTVATQDFEIATGETARLVFINDAIQHPLTLNNATEINTFTQDGTTVTLNQTTEENNYIAIYHST